MKNNMTKVSREIKKIYFETDVQMKKIEKICEKGCSYCCHQVIPVHHAEELPIIRYLNENSKKVPLEQIKKNIILWLDYFNANTPEGVLNSSHLTAFAKKHISDLKACPFLINSECSIYQVRPLVCRTFSVNDNVELCENDPSRNGDEKGYLVQKTMFDRINKAADFVGTRYLSYAVAESLGIQYPFKAIGISLIPTLKN